MKRLDIATLELVAEGGNRRIYQYPGNTAWLVKVLRPERPDGGKRRRFRGTFRRLGPYTQFSREIMEYLAMHAGAAAQEPLIQRIVGFVETHHGLGLVVEAARDADGNLAPTLADLVDDGSFHGEPQQALESFLLRLVESPVIVSDLHWRNLVYAWDPATGSSRFLMVDGLGLANPLPLKAMFPSLNRRSKLSRIRRLKSKLAAALPSGSLIPGLRS